MYNVTSIVEIAKVRHMIFLLLAAGCKARGQACDSLSNNAADECCIDEGECEISGGDGDTPAGFYCV